MSTWHLFSVAGNGFRWENLPSDPDAHLNGYPVQPHHPPSRLPSMTDLLLQGCSELLDNRNESVGNAPMFRTGSGKSVVVKPSSVSRALSVLGGDDGNIAGQVCERDIGCSLSTSLFQTGLGKLGGKPSAELNESKTFLGLEEYNHEGTFPSLEDTRKPLITNEPYERNVGYNGCTLSNSLFQTGSGKMVGISTAGLAKAKTLLGLQEDNVDSTFQSFEHTQKPSSTNGLCQWPDGYDGSNFSSPLFQTGSGKKVGISSAGLAKAKTLLGLQEDNVDSTFQSFEHTQKPSSTNGLCQWPDGYDGSNFPSPLFLTGSGKKVGISSAGLAKANALLGLQEDNEDQSFQSFQHKVKPSTTYEPCVWRDGNNLSMPLFQTGSGKKVVISSAGLVKARTLLGLQEENENDMFPSAENTRDQSTTNEASRWCYGDNECSSLVCNTALMQNKLCNHTIQSFNQPKKCDPATKPSPIKFHTAGGRSISVSTDALQRARSLLGDPELGSFLNEEDSGDIPFSVSKERRCLNDTLSNKKVDLHASVIPKKVAKRKHGMQTFISPVRISSGHVHSSSKLRNIDSGSNLMKKFDAVDCSSDGSLDSDISCQKKPLSNSICTSKIETKQSLPNCIASTNNLRTMSSGGPLVDISNTIGTCYRNDISITTDKKRLGRINSVSPFKRPRSFKFSTPMRSGDSFVSNGLSTLSSRHPICNRRVFARYPFQEQRMFLKEFFGVPPSNKNMLEHLSDQVIQMNCDVAENYMFPDGSNSIGPDAFRHMLIQSGASIQYASRGWVINHYKWIVWKLACYERCYPAKSVVKFLTVSNVLEELKYRYEREINCGQRSAIKRILEGDASPSSMLVLCISAIRLSSETNSETHCLTVNATDNSNTIRVELTDGWYSVHGSLDVLLLKQLAAGKLFVGQKLQIRGATLCGWEGPVSPLEASRTVSLLLHINGTYRAHWANKLGFCKDFGVPLAFRLIKGTGGTVPRTIVGVTRIYPLLYKEKLSGGGSVVRSERMESQMMQLYNQRRSLVVEGVISECQRGSSGPHVYNDSDSDGANIFKLLETTAEPEVLMAEMTSEQLNSFASYQAKQEAMRHLEMEKLIEKALEDAGLTTREVTAFIRVRVVGLTSKTYKGKNSIKEGIITIWSPTEKQKNELVEGQAYVFSGLTPVNSDSDTLYLQARGSATRWQPLSSLAVKNFKPFFSPRKSIILSDLGEVPLSSEFDIAAYVVFVGEAYTAGHQKKQWVFVADSSTELQSEESSNSLLAISFCSSCTTDSFPPVNLNLVGSTVGFCNLIKREKDQMNHIWVAEGTENSMYFTSFDSAHCSHLKKAACCAERWAKASNSIIEKLKEEVLFIIGDCKK